MYGRPIVYVVVVISANYDGDGGGDVSNRYAYVEYSSGTSSSSTRHYDGDDSTNDDGFAKGRRSVRGGGWEVFVGIGPRGQK